MPSEGGVCVCGGGRGRGGGGGNTPTPNPPPHVSVKFPDNAFGKFRVFYHKTEIIMKCRILLISSPPEIKLLPAMTAFKEVI